MSDDEVIKLSIEFQAKDGLSSRVEKITGTIEDCVSSIKKMASAPGQGGLQKHQLAELWRQLIQINLAAKNAKNSIESISATGIGTEGSKLKATYSKIGSGAQTRAEQVAYTRQQDSQMRSQASFMDRQFDKNSRMRNTASAMDLGFDRRREAAYASQQKSEAKAKSDMVAKNMQKAVMTTGFLGLSITGALEGMLDPVRAQGILTPNISKICGFIGSMFSQTLGEIFSSIGDVLGRILEVAFDTVFSVLRAGLKFITGLMSGMFISLIQLTPVTAVLGIVFGFVQGIVQAFTELLSSVVSIVQNLLGAITSIISAGLKIVSSIFEGFVNFVKNIWNGLWEGMKSIAEFSIAAINKGVEQLISGFSDYVKNERMAATASQQIVDQNKKMNLTFDQGTEAVRKLINSFRTDFGTDQATTAKAAYFVLSSQFRSTAEASDIMNASGKIATLTNEDMATTTITLVRAMSAYGASSGDAEKYAASMNTAVNLGLMTMQEYNQEMQRAVFSAQAAGLSFDNFNILFAGISRTGIGAELAMTGLNRIMNAIISPTKQNEKAMAQLGLQFKEVIKQGIKMGDVVPRFLAELSDKVPEDMLRKLFGDVRGTTVARALKQRAAEILEVVKEFPEVAKEFGMSFKGMTSVFDFLFRRIRQMWEVLWEDLGRGFFKVMKEPLKLILPLFDRISKAITGPNMEKFFMSWEKYLTPVINTIMPGLLSILEDVAKFLETGDLSAIFENKKVVAFRDYCVEIYNNVIGMVKEFNRVFGILGGVWTISLYIANTMLQIVGWMTQISENKKVVDVFWRIKEIMVEIGTIMKESFLDPEKMVANFNIVFEFIKTAFLEVGGFILAVLKDVFSMAIKFFMATFGPVIKEGMRSIMVDLLSGMSNSLRQMSKNASAKSAELLASKKFLSPIEGIKKTAESDAMRALSSATLTLSDIMRNLIGGMQYPEVGKTEEQRSATFDIMKKYAKENNGELELDFVKNISDVMERVGFDKVDVEDLFHDIVKKKSYKEFTESGKPGTRLFLDTLLDELVLRQEGKGYLREEGKSAITLGKQRENAVELYKDVSSFGTRLGERGSELGKNLGIAGNTAREQLVTTNNLNPFTGAAAVAPPYTESEQKTIVLTLKQIKEAAGLSNDLQQQIIDTLKKTKTEMTMKEVQAAGGWVMDWNLIDQKEMQ